jgi:hypothetical protein
MNPRVPMGHLRTEIMSNSCDPQQAMLFWAFRRRRPFPHGLALRAVSPSPLHPPAGPSSRPSTVPSWLVAYPVSTATGTGRCSWRVCVGAAAAGVLSGACRYGFAVAPRRTSSGHARSCLCHWGGRHLCSAPVCDGPSWPGGLVRRAAYERGAVRRKQPAVLHCCWRRRPAPVAQT